MRARHNSEADTGTLDAEHRALLAAVFQRAEPVLARASTGRWPEVELQALVDVLGGSVLRQMSDEERLLFLPTCDQSAVAALMREHVMLRGLIRRLGELCSQGGPIARLTILVDELVTVLVAHLDNERHVLATLPGAPARLPATTTLRAHPSTIEPIR